MDQPLKIVECQEPWLYWWETLRVHYKMQLLATHLKGRSFSGAEFGFGGELVDPVYIQVVWEAVKPPPLPDHEWLSLAASIVQDHDTLTEAMHQEIWRQVYRIASDRI